MRYRCWCCWFFISFFCIFFFHRFNSGTCTYVCHVHYPRLVGQEVAAAPGWQTRGTRLRAADESNHASPPAGQGSTTGTTRAILRVAYPRMRARGCFSRPWRMLDKLYLARRHSYAQTPPLLAPQNNYHKPLFNSPSIPFFVLFSFLLYSPWILNQSNCLYENKKDSFFSDEICITERKEKQFLNHHQLLRISPWLLLNISRYFFTQSKRNTVSTSFS